MAAIFRQTERWIGGTRMNYIQRVRRRDAATGVPLEEGFAYGAPFRPGLIRDRPEEGPSPLWGVSDGPGGLPPDDG